MNFFLWYLLLNGADPMALTSENERPIDLADQTDFPTISLLLNHMKSSGEDCEDDYDTETSADDSTKPDNSNNNDFDDKVEDEKGSPKSHENIANGKKKKSRFSIV